MLGLGFRIGTVAAVLAHFSLLPPVVMPHTAGFVGQNLAVEDVTRDAFGAAVLDKSKTSDAWTSPGSGLVLNANGFPTNIPAGSYNETLWNVESTVTRPGLDPSQNIHVIESNCGVVPYAAECLNGTYLSDTTDGNGVRRIEYLLNVPQLAAADHDNAIRVFMQGPFPSSGAFAHGFHKLDEAEFRTGEIYRQQFVDRIKNYGCLRYMDWAGIKSAFGNAQVNFSQYQLKDAVSWAGQVPLEHQIGLSNRSGVDAHLHFPHSGTDQFVRDFMAVCVGSNGLAAGRRAWLENTNEAWDSGGPQYSYYSNPGWPQDTGAADKAWGAYGYRSAQMMAIAMQAVGYDPRFRSYLGFQTAYTTQLEGVLLGAKRAIADWSNPNIAPYDIIINGQVVGRGGYNAEFAAKFKYVGQLFPDAGGANYLGGGMGRSGWPQADSDEFLTWCRATDDSGLAAFFNQLRTGSPLSDPNGFNLAAWPTTFAPCMAILIREQIRWRPYEGCICVEDFGGTLTDEMKAFRTRAMHDPRMIQLTIDWAAASAAAGVDFFDNLCELSGPGGAYGSREQPFINTFPRDVGLLQVQANPPAVVPLHVSYALTGSVKTGASPVYMISVQNGRGKIKVELVTAAPEQSLEFRKIAGVLATAGNYPIRLKVTDETTSPPLYFDIPQNVVQSLDIPASRYWKFTTTAPLYGDRVGINELRFKDAHGNVITPTGWVGTAPGINYGGNTPDHLCDGANPGGDFCTESGNTFPVTVFIDCGSPVKPSSIDVVAFSAAGGQLTYFSPADMTIAASTDGETYQLVADRPASAGWDYGPGFVNVPLDFSGQVT